MIDSSIYFFSITVFILLFKNQIAQENIKWISIVFYFLYYFLFEMMLGQTPGKMFTGSKTVSITGNREYFFIQILIRSLTRFLPLDMLSYLFSYRGLHDWISKTTIVKL